MEYHKVPTPTQYSTWTDADQQKADAMVGPRYYLPRPFLVLKQPLPVAERSAFVSFVYNAKTGVYDLETPADSWVAAIAPKSISPAAALAIQVAGPPKLNNSPVAPQGAPAGDKGAGGTGGNGTGGNGTPTGGNGTGGNGTGGNGTGGNGTATGGNGTGGNGTPPPSTLQVRDGFINATDPITRLTAQFDVAYFPDFEEQFVAVVNPGLGKADMDMQMRNGWAIEVFGGSVDNSNLIPYLIKQVSDASAAALNIATTWGLMAVPGGQAVVAAKGIGNFVKLEGAPTGNLTADQVKATLGELLVFKIAEVKIAQPGIYPILKPREVLDWAKRWKSETQTGSLENLTMEQKMKNTVGIFLGSNDLSWFRSDMVFVPLPPITMIGFNTMTDVLLLPPDSPIGIIPMSALQGGSPNSNNDDGDGGDGADKLAFENNATQLKGFLEAKLKSDASFPASIAPSLTISHPGAESSKTLITFTGKSGATSLPSDADTLRNWLVKNVPNVKDSQVTILSNGKGTQGEAPTYTFQITQSIDLLLPPADK